MTRKKLPIGIQTFAKIREADYYYVDKTGIAVDLADSGSHYFLSRPRRFGKSLFLDTLKELFEGNQPLFKGLAAVSRWDWAVKYPVLRISFGGGVLGSVQDLKESLHRLFGDQRHRCPCQVCFSHGGEARLDKVGFVDPESSFGVWVEMPS